MSKTSRGVPFFFRGREVKAIFRLELITFSILRGVETITKNYRDGVNAFSSTLDQVIRKLTKKAPKIVQREQLGIV